jgi:YebC/PmpR family DNA-binding regulatory protein
MGRQWLAKKKEINANKRAKITSKLVREITVAAKLGAPDPEMNARLAVAVEAARKQSVSNDVILRAIKKGGGTGGEAVALELVTYEAMSPQKVPVIVECLTDNRNRTAPDMRSLFRDGQFGAKVMFYFTQVGLIEAAHGQAGLDCEEVAIEAGAQNVQPMDVGDDGGTSARFITDPPDLDAVTKALRAKGWSVTQSEFGYIPKEKMVLDEATRAALENFLEHVDDHDDCHRIYTGAD